MVLRSLRATAAVLLVALTLLAPGVAAQWDQLAGDAGRSSRAELPTGPYDIVSRYRIFEPPDMFHRIVGPALVETPYGLTGVARNVETGACTLVHVTDALAGKFVKTTLDGCRDAWFQGYAASTDAIYVCEVGGPTTARVASYGAGNGTLRWTVTPEQLGMTGTGQTAAPGEVPGVAACLGTAIDESDGRLVGGFGVSNQGFDYAVHRVFSIDLASGEVQWSTVVSTWTLTKQDTSALPTGPYDGAGPNFVPIATTLTRSGVVVTGLAACPDLVTCERPQEVLTAQGFRPVKWAVAWLTSAGEPRGMMWAGGDPSQLTDDDPDLGDSTGASLYASAWGNRAAQVIASHLVIIEPEAPSPAVSVPLSFPEGERPGMDSYILAWTTPDTVLAWLDASVSAIDLGSETIRWTWPTWRGWLPTWYQVVTPADEAFVLLVRDDVPDDVGVLEEFETDHALARLDLVTGQLRQIIEFVDFQTIASEPGWGLAGSEPLARWDLHPSPVPDGRGNLVLAGPTGMVTVLSPASPERAPAVSTSDPYPAPGDVVTITVGPGALPNATSVQAAWGDGVVDQAAWNTTGPVVLSHVYERPRRYEALVTVQDDAGLTGSRAVSLDVGGSPPVTPGLGGLVLPGAGGQATSWAVLLLVSALALAAVVTARRRSPAGEQASTRHLDAYERALSMQLRHGDRAADLTALMAPLRDALGVSDKQHARILEAIRARHAGGPEAPVPGERFLQRYEVVERLGQGSGGTTYLCHDTRIGRKVVVKALSSPLDDDADALVREARAFGAVDHDHVVTLHDVEQVGNRVYLVLDYLEGGSLADRLEQGPLTSDELARLGEHLLASLEAVHGAGVVHRDVKPSNVLIDDDGDYELADFGIAHLPDYETTMVGLGRGGDPAGTIQYMSPEQARGATPDHRSDLYSAAVVLWEAATGRRYMEPDPDETAVELQMRIARGEALPDVHEGLPAPLGSWLVKALAHDRDGRFPSARAMLKAAPW